MSLLSNITDWYFSKRAIPYWCILIMDACIVVASGVLAYYVEFGGGVLASNFWMLVLSSLVILIPYGVFFRVFHTYSGVVRYSSFVDLGRIGTANFLASICAVAMLLLYDAIFISAPHLFTIETIVLIFVFSSMIMFVSRVVVKSLYDTVRSDTKTKRAFVYGVKSGGIALAKSIQNQDPKEFSLVGFVSPDGDMSSKYLMGVKVFKDDKDLIEHMAAERAVVLLVSPLQSEHFREKQELIDDLTMAHIQIMMMPDAERWDGKSAITHNQLHEVEIEDLLPREKIEVDMDAIGALLKNKKIFITGAAGSIGSEMVRQIAAFNPEVMVLVDQAETPMHDIRLLMARKYGHIKCETVVSSICNEEHMEKLFSEHKPDYVFHAAAYKHVPMMEDNPGMAVQNNIAGTRVIADLAVKYGTKKFVMISTDKAVNPTNVMGCSKRICEIYCQSLNKAIVDGTAPKQADGKPAVTQFVTTRFGNVLGSNGSVIPIFREQIRKGGPVTVTHPDIIRFFMLIPEACKLVLEAGTMGKGGEIFVFDMGKPVRIVDLAKRMIKLSGAQNIEIQFTGLRDGEKLYEEVLSDKENTKPTVHPKIMIASVREYDYETAVENEKRLLELSRSFDDMAIVKLMKEIVPEYKSRCSKYEALD